MNKLPEQVAYDVSQGAVDCSKSLGIRQMPDGYALMWDGESMYYWLRYDGKYGWKSWDKWYCWRSAKLNTEGQISDPELLPTNTTEE